jgi:hypothetical protein
VSGGEDEGVAPEFVLFGEDASRIVISCDPAKLTRIKEVAAKHGISADLLGETVAGNLEIKLDGRAVISASIAELRDVYENALERALRSEAAQGAAD